MLLSHVSAVSDSALPALNGSINRLSRGEMNADGDNIEWSEPGAFIPLSVLPAHAPSEDRSCIAEVALYGRGWDNVHNDTAYDLAYPGQSLYVLCNTHFFNWIVNRLHANFAELLQPSPT